jgi:hypothetical protein
MISNLGTIKDKSDWGGMGVNYAMEVSLHFILRTTHFFTVQSWVLYECHEYHNTFRTMHFMENLKVKQNTYAKINHKFQNQLI